MDPLAYEFIIGPQLEKDISEYYKAIRFGRAADGVNYQDHVTAINHSLKKVLLGYFKDWNFLMFSRKDQVFSFWLEEFRNVYFSVLRQNDIGYFISTQQKNEKWLIEQIVVRLEAGFLTTGFMEKLNKYNDKYSKRIEKLREKYCTTSKFSADAPDVKFLLGFYDQSNELFDIQRLTEKFRMFEKILKSQAWYQAEVIFTYFNFVRDFTQHRYVIHFYLTFYKHLFSNSEDYQQRISKLWLDVTEQTGVLLSCVQAGSGAKPYMLEQAHPFDIVESRSALDDLEALPANDTGTGEYSTRICIAPLGFIPFNGYPNSQLR